MSAATFVVNEEDHTLGNALRYVLMKESVSLRAPCPTLRLCAVPKLSSVATLHRIRPRTRSTSASRCTVRREVDPRMGPAHLARTDGENAMQALMRALNNLEALTQAILEKYSTDLAREAYSTETDEPEVDWDDINARAEANREKKKAEREAAKKAAPAAARNVGR